MRAHPGRALAFAFGAGWLLAEQPAQSRRVLTRLAARLLGAGPRE